MTGHFHYFAYGSNLKLSEITRTCPSAIRVAVARLPNHRLLFPRFSTSRGGGVASIEPSAGEFVWGAVYQIEEAEKPALNAREGYKAGRAGNAYEALEIAVEWGGIPTDLRRLLTYKANSQPGIHLPTSEYLRLIIDGARECGFRDDYIKNLEKIETHQT